MLLPTCAIAAGKSPTDEFVISAPVADHPVQVELIAEHASVQPGGATRIGAYFQIAEGWHIYGEQPGDAGLPTSVAWRVPEGVTIGPLAWPQPSEFEDPGNIHTRGYQYHVLLWSRLAATAQVSGDIPIQAKLRWLACKDICLPGKANLELTLPVSPQAPVASAHADLFPPS